MEYTKPHLTWDEQLALLQGRGMVVEDRAAAVSALRRIGYYRLSGYWYPFREVDREATHQAGHPVRSDRFQPGTRFELVVQLHDFDDQLRRTMMAALQALEVTLRVKVSYRIGAVDPMGHLSGSALDPAACGRAPRGPRGRQHQTAFSAWRAEYDQLQTKAGKDVYVQHFVTKYDGMVPVWAACEFMTMGCLVALFQLMTPKDRRRVASEFGVRNAQVLDGWLRALNVTRNHCAHNGRLWNRATVYPPDRINPKMVPEPLHHLRDVDSRKLYFLVAVLAHLLDSLDGPTDWADELVTVFESFPAVPGVGLVDNAGFIRSWRDESLWRHHQRP